MIEISSEDIEKIRRFKAIMDKGFYASGQEVTDLHNKVLGTRLASTNCGSCIRQRISALVDALNKFIKAQELEKKTEANDTPPKEPQSPRKAVNNLKSKRKK